MLIYGGRSLVLSGHTEIVRGDNASEEVCPIKLERRLATPTKKIPPYHEWMWKPKGKDKSGAKLKQGVCKLCGLALEVQKFCRRCGLRLDRWGAWGNLCYLCMKDNERVGARR